jgi:hypothetical protein
MIDTRSSYSTTVSHQACSCGHSCESHRPLHRTEVVLPEFEDSVGASCRPPTLAFFAWMKYLLTLSNNHLCLLFLQALDVLDLDFVSSTCGTPLPCLVALWSAFVANIHSAPALCCLPRMLCPQCRNESLVCTSFDTFWKGPPFLISMSCPLHVESCTLLRTSWCTFLA